MENFGLERNGSTGTGNRINEGQISRKHDFCMFFMQMR